MRLSNQGGVSDVRALSAVLFCVDFPFLDEALQIFRCK